MAWSKIPLKKKKSNVPRALDSLLKCFPLHPTHTPRPAHHQAIPHLNFWLSQKSTGSLEAGPETQQSPRLSHHLYSAGNAPPAKQPPESWVGGAARNVRGIWVGTREASPTFPQGPGPGYVRGCKTVLTLPPNFQLNQKLDIQGKGQECGQPGAGTLLPQFVSWPTSTIQAIQMCLLNRNILSICLKRKSSVPDFEQ